MLLKYILIILCILMSLFGLSFLILFLKSKKTVNKENEKELRNLKLDLMLAIIFLVGVIITASFVPFIF
ncbi:MAG: hypothetical protein RR047_00140 [Bacilli bacterium]